MGSEHYRDRFGLSMPSRLGSAPSAHYQSTAANDVGQRLRGSWHRVSSEARHQRHISVRSRCAAWLTQREGGRKMLRDLTRGEHRVAIAGSDLDQHPARANQARIF